MGKREDLVKSLEADGVDEADIAKRVDHVFGEKKAPKAKPKVKK